MTAMSTVYDDLDYLREHGALDGVGEIIRARRRQIEKGYTVQHDCEQHGDGALMNTVALEAAYAVGAVAEFSDGPAECERSMAKAGAYAAAEIDRLNAEFSP